MGVLVTLVPLIVFGGATCAWLIVLSRRQRALSARLGLHVCRYPVDDEDIDDEPDHGPGTVTVAELLAREAGLR